MAFTKEQRQDIQVGSILLVMELLTQRLTGDSYTNEAPLCDAGILAITSAKEVLGSLKYDVKRGIFDTIRSNAKFINIEEPVNNG